LSPTPAIRFAPSPTGRLHRGHAFSALLAAETARDAGGRFILRIEDIDEGRCRPEFEAAIYEDLAWLGLAWDQPVRRQSEHLDDYGRALDRLRDRGLVYRCFKTRREVLDAIASAPHGAQPSFTGARLSSAEETQRLDAGEPFAWRLSIAAAKGALGPAFEALAFTELGQGPDGEHGRQCARPEPAGDVILARKGLGVAYHLAVVVDDALQGVSHVVRGEDLYGAVHIQRLLQALLGLPTPLYRHHRLLARPDGRRYAKRDRAETLAEIRASGVSPEALRRELGLKT
jgi:glutamyl-Q tRNA(Asp) synthetase